MTGGWKGGAGGPSSEHLYVTFQAWLPCYHGSGLQEQVLPETKAEAAPLGVSGMSKNL